MRALPLLLVTALLLPGLARAQRCHEELTDGEVRARIDFIERELGRQQRPSRAWWYGWTFGLTVIGVGQTAGAFLLDDSGDAAASAIGAVGSFAGAAALLFQPLPTVNAADRIARFPGSTPAERHEKLLFAERLLRRSAVRERKGRSALKQLPLVPWIVGTGLLLGIRYSETQAWFRLAVGSVLVLEARVLTQPTSAIGTHDGYRQGAAHCMAPSLREPPAPIRMELVGAPGGLGLALRF